MTLPDNDLILSNDNLPGRSDALKNRALILDAARRLFAEKGADNVSMEDIARATGLGRATLYRNFKDGKVQLSQSLLDEDQRDLQERTLAQIRSHPDPLENLRWFLREVLLFVERNGPMLCLYSRASDPIQHSAHWWWRQTIRGLLGQLHPMGDLDYLADAIYALLDVHAIYFLREMRGYSLERVTVGMLSMVENIIGVSDDIKNL
jgi:AcrR family transcriptional regulator